MQTATEATKKPRKSRRIRPDSHKELLAIFRDWLDYPTGERTLELLVSKMVDFEIKAHIDKQSN